MPTCPQANKEAKVATSELEHLKAELDEVRYRGMGEVHQTQAMVRPVQVRRPAAAVGVLVWCPGAAMPGAAAAPEWCLVQVRRAMQGQKEDSQMVSEAPMPPPHAVN